MINFFKRKWIFIVNTCFLIAVLYPSLVSKAGSKESIDLSEESTLAIYGTSTVRNFSSNATDISITADLEASRKAHADGLKVKVGKFTIAIPIAGLKSGSALLDEHLSEALKADQFPEIRGTLKNYEVQEKIDDDSHKVRASIDLTIAGVVKTQSVDGTVTVEGDKVRIKGEKQLLMTDFGVEPPSVMLGMIKAANEITIRFNLLIALKKNVNKGDQK